MNLPPMQSDYLSVVRKENIDKRLNGTLSSSLEEFRMDGSSGLGRPTNLPSHHGSSMTVALKGFRSRHGCGAAGAFYPSSSHPSLCVFTVDEV